MRIEQLRYLLAIVQAGSFRRAAEELHLSQAALSETIKHLESDLGSRLLQRNRRGVRLTDVGTAVLPHVESLLSAEQALRDEVDGYLDLRRGKVRLGTVNAGSNTILAPVLVLFNRRYPGIQIQVTETGSMDIAHGVRTAELDLGLVVRLEEGGMQYDEDLAFEDLLSSRIVVCAPKGHRILRRQDVSVQDVAQESLILFRSGYLMHDLMNDLLKGSQLNVVYYTDNTESAKRMIAAGVGVTLLPEFSVVDDALSRSNSIVYVPLVGQYSDIKLCLTRRSKAYIPRATHALWTALREEALHGGTPLPRA